MIVSTFRYLHIGFCFRDWIDLEAIDRVLTESAADWLRYSPQCAIVWTDLSPSYWYDRLLSVPNMERNYFLVCPIDIHDRSGWLPDSVWNWLMRPRTAERLIAK